VADCPLEGSDKMTIEDAALKRAIEWMSARLKEEPEANRGELIDQASREFGLSPLQEEFLYRQFGKLA
jgi:hypothetical protein